MSTGSDTLRWVRLDAASRELRRLLRPIEWVVLEDVALDAVADGAGALVAATSARQVAEHLGLTPGAAARALARLRSEGLLVHAQEAGPAGRFGLSAYVLSTVPGLDVVGADVPAGAVGPGTTAPRAASPSAAVRHTASPSAASPRAAVRHTAFATTTIEVPSADAAEQMALLTEPPTVRPSQ
jgi:hypothetical protein